MALNVGGVSLGSRRFLSPLAETRGVVTDFCSVNRFLLESAGASYCATEAAIVGLTMAMATDHGREGERVHAVCPGYTDAGLAANYCQSQSDPPKGE
jgi:meso-butanediol dehydrogenase/(S,S)-butanediol dehydrogenase/diacetyl reductase